MSELSKDEFAELDELLTRLELEGSRGSLTEWEIGFLDDMIHRVDKYQERVFVSDKQWEQLERMEGKYL